MRWAGRYLAAKPAPPPLHARRLSLDDPAYRALWAESPQRSAFAHPAFVHAVGDAFGLETGVALGVADGGALAAALPLFERKRGPFRALVVPPLVPFVSPLLAGPLCEDRVHRRTSPLDRLLEAVATEYDRATLLLHPSLTDARPLTWAGWQVRPRYTYTLDLGDDDLLARWSGGTRRTASKAAGAYTFEEHPDLAEEAFARMRASYDRQSEPFDVEPEAVRTLLASLHAAGLVRAFGVRTEAGAVEAAVAVAHDGRAAHYWIAGSRPGPAMTVLLARLLPRLREDGLHTFDFQGANVPSIAEFKRRFGPVLTPYTLAQRDFHPALRALGRLRGHG